MKYQIRSLLFLMKSKIYFTKEITSESLVKIYEMLGRELKGKVCVKISTGEPGGHNFFDPNQLKNLVSKLKVQYVNVLLHLKANEILLKFIDKHLKIMVSKQLFLEIFQMKKELLNLQLQVEIILKLKNIVGSHIKNYDSALVLSDFKGH